MTPVIDKAILQQCSQFLTDPESEKVLCCQKVTNSRINQSSILLFTTFQCIDLNDRKLNKKGKAIRFKQNLFDIIEIHGKGHSLTFKFDDDDSNFHYDTPQANEIAAAVASSVRELFAHSELPKIHFEGYNKRESVRPNPFLRFQMKLLARNLHGRVSPDLYDNVSDYFSSSPVSFSFKRFRQLSTNALAILLGCILIDTGITTIIADSLNSSEYHYLCSLMGRPSRIKRIEFEGSGDPLDLRDLATAVRRNRKNRLSELSFRDFPLAQKTTDGIEALFGLIDNCRQQVTHLSIKSSISPAAVRVFIESARGSTKFAGIERFAFGGTPFSRSDLQKGLPLTPNIQVLSLCACGVEISELLAEIKRAHLSQLVALDLSGNTCRSPISSADIPKSVTSFQAADVLWEGDTLFSALFTLLHVIPAGGRVNLSGATLANPNQPNSNSNQPNSNQANSNSNQANANHANANHANANHANQGKGWAALAGKLPQLQGGLLESLSWRSNRLSPALVELLGKMPNLTTLDLSGALQPGDQGTRALLTFLPSSRIATLVVEATQISTLSLNDLTNLFRALQQVWTLRRLDVSGHNAGAALLKPLLELVSANSALSYVNFTGNSIFEVRDYLEFFGRLTGRQTRLEIEWPAAEITAMRKSRKLGAEDVEVLKAAFEARASKADLAASQKAFAAKTPASPDMESDMRIIQGWKNDGGYKPPADDEDEEDESAWNMPLDDLPRIELDSMVDEFITEFSLASLLTQMRKH